MNTRLRIADAIARHAKDTTYTDAGIAPSGDDEADQASQEAYLEDTYGDLVDEVERIVSEDRRETAFEREEAKRREVHPTHPNTQIGRRN